LVEPKKNATDVHNCKYVIVPESAEKEENTISFEK